MTINFDITSSQYQIVHDILVLYLPKPCKVWVFGSRAKKTAQDYSDLDLALEDTNTVDYNIMMQLKCAFEESRLPYTVDVVDLRAVEPYFKTIIDEKKIAFPLSGVKGKME